MSWDNYLDNLVKESNDSAGKAHCDRAAIISIDGGELCNTPNHPHGIQLTPAEAQKIAQMMKSADFSSAYANGMVLEGLQYQLLKEDGKVVLAQKKGFGSITIQKSKMAVVIGHTSQGSIQGYTNKAVAVIADYLESVGM